MRNKYRKKLYHYNLKRKYGNSVALGEKSAVEVMQELKSMFNISPISETNVDYMGVSFLHDMLGRDDSENVKIFRVEEDSTTALFYKYYRERYVGNLCIYVYYEVEEQRLFSNCDLLDCKLQIMKGISKTEIENSTVSYWHYLDMCHQYDIMQKPYK